MDIIDRLHRKRRLEGAGMLLLAVVLAAIVILLMIPAGIVHLKLVVAAGAFLLVGMWRLLRAPWWIRRPDEVECIEPASRNQLQIIMRGGRLYEVAAEREELELAIQQRANAIRLRARVVR